MEQSRTIGIASFDDLEGGVGAVSYGGGEAPVHHFIEIAGVEADCCSVFAATDVYLEEIAFLKGYIIKGEKAAFVVVGDACGGILYRVCEYIVGEGVDVFVSLQHYVLILRVSGMVDFHEGK